jgi:cephalosporin-C deacetylase-like acetyl esterase
MKTITLLVLTIAASAQTPNLDFLTNQVDGRALREMLPTYLREQVRLRRNTAPTSRATFRARFIEGLGGLPARTPLNARVAGTLERDGYRIEKIIFESQPGFFVTANLYLPTSGKPPYPAILFPIGHEPGAKAYPVWQQILATFARRGYVALTWDQLGQGERVQHWDDALGSSKVAPSTTEHTVLGIQTLVTGDALAKYTIWDGIRALDYLLSRPEVDAKRVGVTGNSGGGTHSTYLAALDDRLHVAAPSCFITSWQRLLETIGPQDAEQCIPGFLGSGFEHVDFIRAFAPKPFLVMSAIRDFFSLQGARSTFATATEAYIAASARDRISMAETDEGHGYSSELRLASYAWFDRWLKNKSAPAREEAIPPATPEELACTATGQVATALNGETVFTLNRTRARALNTPASVAPDAVRRQISWREDNTPPTVRAYGSERAGDLLVEKLVYESEPGILVPAVIVSKPASNPVPRPAVLLASARGKRAAWSELQALASRGAVVLAIDARGLGETRPTSATKGGSWQEWFGDYDSAMTSVMLGSSLVAQRAHDIQRAFHLLAARPGVSLAHIFGAAQGSAAPALLHAAAAGVPFQRLLLDGMIASYRSVAEAPIHRETFESIVPGALRSYDLPGLAAMLLPKPVIIVDAISPMGEPLGLDAARAEFKSVSNARIVTRLIEERPAAAYSRLID